VEELDRLISKHGANGEQSLGANVDRAAMLNWVAFTHRRAGRRVSAARAYVRKAIESRDLASARTALVVLLDPSAVSRSRQVPDITAADSSWLESYRDAFPIKNRRDAPTDNQSEPLRV
jgi:hypothetical protein